MSEFLPEGYKKPEVSDYMKFKQGENTFRVLGSAITGFEYWNKENKPVRSRNQFEGVPDDAKLQDGEFRPKHFWVFPVWNYEASRLQILELTQSGIQDTIKNYTKNPKWGSPLKYDFIVSRVGEGLETEYTTTVNPASELELTTADQIKLKKIDLNKMYDSESPFTK